MANYDPAVWTMVRQHQPIGDIARRLGVTEAEARLVVHDLLCDVAAAYREVWEDPRSRPMTPWSAWFDHVTGVENRAAAERYLAWSVEIAERCRRHLSVVFADVDGLKALNDARGHAAGDELLRRVAQAFVRSVRRSDKAFRWGGDEFLLLFPGADAQAATSFVNRVRQAHRCLPFSAGIAEWRPGDTPATLVDRADRAMYADKAQRRPTGVPFSFPALIGGDCRRPARPRDGTD